ncbi:MAG: toll/interleukin-1 receptor domain-containing protein [Chloroflexi bacterium]|nr:toll/interleukin-1 receptor domain-containing protein [Chloroflexota bacterium]
MSGSSRYEYDLFISHASEDQEAIARPLAEALNGLGYKVWYSEWSLTLGDRLRQKIDRGLLSSRFGVVVLSRSFFEKHWPKQELDGLAALEADGEKRILPIWHGVDQPAVASFSPTLADRMAVETRKGVGAVVREVARALELRAREGDVAADVQTDTPPPSLQQDSSVATTTAAIKRMMASPTSRIELQDLIFEQVRRIEAVLAGPSFDVSAEPNPTSIAARIFEYDRLVLPLAPSGAVGAYWADADQAGDWVRAITRMANARPAADGFVAWRELRLYPAMVLGYSCGLGALANGRYGTLWTLLNRPIVRDRDEQYPACAKLAPFLVAGGTVGKSLPGKERHHTPVSDHLIDQLAPLLARLFDDPDAFESGFDEYEMWLALAHFGGERKAWTPLGRFAWNYRHRKERGPRARFSDVRYRTSILKAGAFDGDAGRLDEALGFLDTYLDRVGGQFY